MRAPRAKYVQQEPLARRSVSARVSCRFFGLRRREEQYGGHNRGDPGAWTGGAKHHVERGQGRGADEGRRVTRRVHPTPFRGPPPGRASEKLRAFGRRTKTPRRSSSPSSLIGPRSETLSSPTPHPQELRRHGRRRQRRRGRCGRIRGKWHLSLGRHVRTTFGCRANSRTTTPHSFPTLRHTGRPRPGVCGAGGDGGGVPPASQGGDGGAPPPPSARPSPSPPTISLALDYAA